MSRVTSGDVHVFLWQNDKMTDLGSGGFTSAYGYGINSAGQVVGIKGSEGTPNTEVGPL